MKGASWWSSEWLAEHGAGVKYVVKSSEGGLRWLGHLGRIGETGLIVGVG